MGSFSSVILAWYKRNKRPLPWRSSRDPYAIWLSEVILQQTRVEQGLPYFQKLINAFPDVYKLAAAGEDDFLRHWQGLGYYSRAINLLSAARKICQRPEGSFPASYEELLLLPGIGPYTAAAISSIAYGEPRAVLDGNVIRILSRYKGIRHPFSSAKGKDLFEKTAARLLDRNNPGDYNQALMDFGAMVCTPGSPDCRNCPLRTRCVAWKQNAVHLYPCKPKKKARRTMWINYFVFKEKGKYHLVRRGGNGIWKNLYEFPSLETPAAAGKKEISTAAGKGFLVEYKLADLRQELTHRTVVGTFWKAKRTGKMHGKVISARLRDMDNFAFPAIINRFIKNKLLI